MSVPKSKTLVNGLRIVYIPHVVGSVTVCLRGLAGSNYEKPYEIGAAHVLEHLSTFRSKKYSRDNFLRNIIFNNGGRITGTTSRDDVAYLVKTLKRDYRKALLFLSEVFFHPLLLENDLNKTKSIITHEIMQNIEDPKRHIGRISYKIMYPAQRFAELNTGNFRHLKSLTLENIKNFRKKHYKPANFVLAVSGDLNENELFLTVEKLFSQGKKEPRQPVLKHQENKGLAYQIENRANLKQTHIKIDYHGFNTGNIKKYAAFLLAKLFHHYLWKNIHASYESSHLAPYVLDSASFSSHTYGLFGTYTGVKPGDLKNFLLIYKKTIKNILQEKILENDITFVKNKINADFEFVMEKTSLKADFYSELFLYQNLTNNHQDELKNYLRVTKRDLIKTAKETFEQKPKITIIDRALNKKSFEKIWNETSVQI